MNKLLLIPFFIILTIFYKNGFCQDYTTELASHREKYKLETQGRFPGQLQDFYAENTKFRIESSFKNPRKPKTISLPTSGVKIKDYTEFAVVTFKIEGKKYKITTYRPSPVLPLYRNLVFVPFKDPTAPKDTYGGGRYMDMDVNDFKDGKVILDFNKAYNPYCAFSDGWNCPIPPKENHLKVKIEAGEKVPLTGH
ncbi:MAG: DUF1684 domain-containing protein [Leadbetterella sp.]|jgi:uncharacterized protein (DUF1684 family)|nr:DUF1684 domain-containing protein [Leadbetterella sp.]